MKLLGRCVVELALFVCDILIGILYLLVLMCTFGLWPDREE